MKFPDLSLPEGLAFLDNYLSNKSFIAGFEPTQADVQVFKVLAEPDTINYININRWFANIKSFGDEQKQFPVGQIVIEIEQTEKAPVKEVFEPGFVKLQLFFFVIKCWKFTTFCILFMLQCFR